MRGAGRTQLLLLSRMATIRCWEDSKPEGPELQKMNNFHCILYLYLHWPGFQKIQDSLGTRNRTQAQNHATRHTSKLQARRQARRAATNHAGQAAQSQGKANESIAAGTSLLAPINKSSFNFEKTTVSNSKESRLVVAFKASNFTMDKPSTVGEMLQSCKTEPPELGHSATVPKMSPTETSTSADTTNTVTSSSQRADGSRTTERDHNIGRKTKT